MQVVVLTLSDPWAQTDGGTLRTRALLRGLTDLGHDVTAVHPGSPDGTSARSHRVVHLPQPPVGGRQPAGPLRSVKRYFLPMPTAAGARSPQVRAALRSVRAADLLLISQLSAAQYGDVLPAVGLWVDHSDLWSEFARRAAKSRRGPGRLTALMQARRLAAEEVRLSGQASIVTAAGLRDAELLRGRAAARTTWLPTPVAVEGPLPRRAAEAAPAAGFIGNFGFEPNRDALEVLLAGWGPQLRYRGWEVLVAGLGSDEVPLPDWVRRVGPVQSPRDFYARIDLSLAPIRLGGGMKVKVVEALLYGKPVLASPFAMEGFPKEVRDIVCVVDVTGVVPDDEAIRYLPPDAGSRLHPFTRQGFNEVLAGLLSS